MAKYWACSTSTARKKPASPRRMKRASFASRRSCSPRFSRLVAGPGQSDVDRLLGRSLPFGPLGRDGAVARHESAEDAHRNGGCDCRARVALTFEAIVSADRDRPRRQLQAVDVELHLGRLAESALAG